MCINYGNATYYKCESGTDECPLIGWVVSKRGVLPVPDVTVGGQAQAKMRIPADFLNKPDPSDGATALAKAAAAAHHQVIAWLVHQGADVHIPDKDNVSPLMLVCQSSADHSYIGTSARHLLVGGAAVDVKDAHGATPAWLACAAGNHHLLKSLVDYGGNCAEPDATSQQTPLDKAFACESVRCIEILRQVPGLALPPDLDEILEDMNESDSGREEFRVERGEGFVSSSMDILQGIYDGYGDGSKKRFPSRLAVKFHGEQAYGEGPTRQWVGLFARELLQHCSKERDWPLKYCIVLDDPGGSAREEAEGDNEQLDDESAMPPRLSRPMTMDVTADASARNAMQSLADRAAAFQIPTEQTAAAAMETGDGPAAGGDNAASPAAKPVVHDAPAKVVVPLCPSAGHPMALSRYADNNYRGGWVCNQCSRPGGSGTERWFCPTCCDDFCYTCYPRPAAVESSGLGGLTTPRYKFALPGYEGNEESFKETITFSRDKTYQLTMPIAQYDRYGLTISKDPWGSHPADDRVSVAVDRDEGSNLVTLTIAPSAGASATSTWYLDGYSFSEWNIRERPTKQSNKVRSVQNMAEVEAVGLTAGGWLELANGGGYTLGESRGHGRWKEKAELLYIGAKASVTNFAATVIRRVTGHWCDRHGQCLPERCDITTGSDLLDHVGHEDLPYRLMSLSPLSNPARSPQAAMLLRALGRSIGFALGLQQGRCGHARPAARHHAGAVILQDDAAPGKPSDLGRPRGGVHGVAIQAPLAVPRPCH